jgi:hypothetical protein
LQLIVQLLATNTCLVDLHPPCISSTSTTTGLDRTFIPEVAIPKASEHHPKLLARAEIG